MVVVMMLVWCFCVAIVIDFDIRSADVTLRLLIIDIRSADVNSTAVSV